MFATNPTWSEVTRNKWGRQMGKWETRASWAKAIATAAVLSCSLSAAWGASVIGGTYHDTADGSCVNKDQCKANFGLAPSPSGVIIETISCRILSYGGPPPVNLTLPRIASIRTQDGALRPKDPLSRNTISETAVPNALGCRSARTERRAGRRFGGRHQSPRCRNDDGLAAT